MSASLLRPGRTRPVEGLDHFPRIAPELTARLPDADVAGDRAAEQRAGERPEPQREERLQQVGVAVQHLADGVPGLDGRAGNVGDRGRRAVAHAASAPGPGSRRRTHPKCLHQPLGVKGVGRDG